VSYRQCTVYTKEMTGSSGCCWFAKKRLFAQTTTKVRQGGGKVPKYMDCIENVRE